jgi:2-polyprenyl-3-methyl-5-hydroxy-6-metoxy-1,4-benzoquinol methylase
VLGHSRIVHRCASEEIRLAIQSEKEMLAKIDCPLCGSSRSKSLFGIKDYAFRVTDDEFGVRRCLDCSCGFLSPRPTEGNVSRFYPPEYYWSYEQQGGALPWSAIVASRERQLVAKVGWIEDLPPGRLLDIGAQKGEFIWIMRQRGWQVEGVEIDPSVPNPSAMPIKYGDFLSIDFKPSSFDCITMWAVLEHVYHPARFVERVSKLLKPGARFVAVVTNFDSIQSRFFRADDCPRHLTFFNRKSVQKICQNHGLELQRLVTDQEIFGGSLHGGLVFGVKRLLGYSVDDVMYEWKNIKEPELFCCRWHGKESGLLRNVSRADRLFSLPLERLLDRIGFGFNMTFRAVKSPIRVGNRQRSPLPGDE